MKLSKRRRFEMLRRDNFACRYCGAKAPFVELHIDHVIPRNHGGTDDEWNMTTACISCNLGKSDGVPDEDIIREVRLDAITHSYCRGAAVVPCMYCAKPVQQEPEDEDQDNPQCESCNAAVSDAYEAGTRWREASSNGR